MNKDLLSFSLILIIMGAIGYFDKYPVDLKAAKDALGNVIKWCGDSDYMNVIALVLAVSAVVLINWAAF